ncbi:MAG: regulator SirB [Proteobacteria bacterium]|nr:regulator SirB [Pseudomonadota bacterium]
MSVYLTLKLFHIIFAAVTFLGFAARGYWMIVASDLLDHRVTRIAPHIIDTLFLASGIGMLLAISLNPLAQPWLLAKFGGLILYVLLGTVAIKRGSNRNIRIGAFIAALATFAYIVGVGLTRSTLSWTAYLRG